LIIEADGPDEQEAVQTLVALITDGFGEEPGA
jgi:phosphotransferase system HPr-like phosphotransfer protein